MKNNKLFAFLLLLLILNASCSIFRRNRGLPCPNAKIMGAEKLLEKEMKVSPKKDSPKKTNGDKINRK